VRVAVKQGRESLESLSKDDLVSRAEALGIDGARKFTRVELVDEIIRASGPNDRGLLGRARDLLRGVVEKGLTRSSPPPASAKTNGEKHTPEPAAELKLDTTPAPPVPTVTLAEIYVEQGHVARAKAILREVLRNDDTDEAARSLLAKLESTAAGKPQTRVEKGALPDDPYARVGIEREAFIEPEAQKRADVPSMLDDAPFPSRYNVDECVAMAVDPTTVYVYWEARAQTVERARRAMTRSGNDAGKSVLRVLIVEPHERGPRVSTRDFDVIDLELGEWFVRELPPSCIVRAAIGLLSGERFLPLAHTLDVEAPASTPSSAIASEYVHWTEGETRMPDGHGPVLAPIGREAGSFGLPPMPEPPEDELGRGLSSLELVKRARVAKARSAASAPGDRTPGMGASDLLAKPGSASWLAR
jgi:hypothetical protein